MRALAQFHSYLQGEVHCSIVCVKLGGEARNMQATCLRLLDRIQHGSRLRVATAFMSSHPHDAVTRISSAGAIATAAKHVKVARHEPPEEPREPWTLARLWNATKDFSAYFSKGSVVTFEYTKFAIHLMRQVHTCYICIELLFAHCR